MSQITQTIGIVESTLEIDLTEATRGAVVGYLNTILADEFVLYTKARNYHWNVVGANFYPLHQFFDAQSIELNQNVDQVAERIRALGGRPLSTLSEFVAAARLTEEPNKTFPAKEMVSKLQADQEAIIRSIRADLVKITKLDDAGTVEFLAGLLESHEKQAWVLRATAPQAQTVKA
jgi:starvation-inducible DNA-binding protein